MSLRTRAITALGIFVALVLVTSALISKPVSDPAPQAKGKAHGISLQQAFILAQQRRAEFYERSTRSVIRAKAEQEIASHRARRIAAEKRAAARAARAEARRAARAKARSKATHTRTVAAAPQPRSGANWDGLAMCESSGDWHINTGNGFYGGIQFTMSTWLSFGGGRYASRADLATREQQIAIGEKVLASQGRGAWPGCTAKGAW